MPEDKNFPRSTTSLTADGTCPECKRRDAANPVTPLYKPLRQAQDNAWGGRKRRFRVRSQSGTLPTQYTYTAQYSHTTDTSTSDISPLSAGFGLMFYVARWDDPSLSPTHYWRRAL